MVPKGFYERNSTPLLKKDHYTLFKTSYTHDVYTYNTHVLLHLLYIILCFTNMFIY